jgi:hypothetical protein
MVSSVEKLVSEVEEPAFLSKRVSKGEMVGASSELDVAMLAGRKAMGKPLKAIFAPSTHPSRFPR